MPLPIEVLTLILAHTDADDRHALRASSRVLCSSIDKACIALTLPRVHTCSPAAAALALRRAAARCHRWGGVRALTLIALGAECMGPALALLNVAARHCPELSFITLARLDRELSLALTSHLSSCRLASLTSLAVTAPKRGRPLLLTPLGELSSLTALTIIGRADGASAAWLPPGLRRLQLGTHATEPGFGGTSWLDAIGACRGLEVLQLCWLDALDLGQQPDDPSEALDYAKFYASVGQLVNLRELSGVFCQVALAGHGGAESYVIDSLEAHLLLPQLTALQRLVLYMYVAPEDQLTELIFMQCKPAIKGPLSSLAAQCATLEELAFGVWPDADTDATHFPP
ncbi:hypothetical protein MNEG_13433 [Monoraphidium neglectum]|uniref:F-box domain-containing protein n=1 Tax=Monoraphidium neglectum TaxID=145388 RepID=A0A0D2LS71_9CHLO|nr:hypothetical protein MNEG_13433 [Monoraphidium neglectum]KIY94529.1 hypothetical protein MNEG_13433 [Monoraphidium neglectum]|eukprot:XP_013893549.1 hypothetical protein MNEG_13433 [Monoraphidium neglectum]